MSRLHDQINHLQSYAVHLADIGISDNRIALDVVPFETATEKGFTLQPTRLSMARANPSVRSCYSVAAPSLKKIWDVVTWVVPPLTEVFEAVVPELPFFLRISHVKAEDRLSIKSQGITLENFGTHPDREGAEEAIFNWVCRASWDKKTERMLSAYASGSAAEARDVSPV